MSKKYANLFEVLRQSSEASSYYASLPDYVQETMRQRASNINSFESLRDYAENLTRGDN